MNLHVRLQDHHWQNHNNSYAKGTAFYKGDIIQSEEVAKTIDEIESESELVRFISDLNGFYSGITTNNEGEVILITDSIQSTTLYYTITENGAIVSDNSNRLLTDTPITEISDIQKYEYLITRFVVGRDTLVPYIKQTMAGEVEVISNKEGETNSDIYKHYEYRPKNGQPRQKKLLSELKEVVTKSFNRLIQIAGDRPIAVSLSAGYDSRLAAVMLSKLGYENVILFTYESKNDEKRVSKQVADDLGLYWELISFKHNEMKLAMEDGLIDDFINETGYLGSVPGIGRLPPMKKAKETGQIPAESIIITGSGAISTGEHIPRSFIRNEEIRRSEFVESILDTNYDACEYSNIKNILSKRIMDSMEKNPFKNSKTANTIDAISAFENWDWKERQSKRIPFTDVYEYLEFDWWLPLWDKEFMKFWDEVPVEYRFDKRLHKELVNELYYEVSGTTPPSNDNLFNKIKRSVGNIPVFGSFAGRVYSLIADPTRSNPNYKENYRNNPLVGWMSEEVYVYLRKNNIRYFWQLYMLDTYDFSRSDPEELPESHQLPLQ